MPTEAKVKQVEAIQQRLAAAVMTIVADYRGLTVGEMQTLRGQLRPIGGEVKVAKNTLARIAARRNGQEAIEPVLEGPTALIFVREDLAANAKAVTDFARASRILTVRGGLLGNRLISAEQVTSLATLPRREELQAQTLGAMVGPVTGLLGIFNSVASSLVSILDQQAAKVGDSAGESVSA